MATLSEVFPCFFLSCKTNARVKPERRGTARTLPNFCVVLFIFFVLFYVFLCCSMYCLFCAVLCIVCVYMRTVLLPPAGYPIAVKYIIYHIFKKRNASYPAYTDNWASAGFPKSGTVLPDYTRSYPIIQRSWTHSMLVSVKKIRRMLFFLLWRCDPTRVMASSFLRFLDHTQ